MQFIYKAIARPAYFPNRLAIRPNHVTIFGGRPGHLNAVFIREGQL